MPNYRANTELSSVPEPAIAVSRLGCVVWFRSTNMSGESEPVASNPPHPLTHNPVITAVIAISSCLIVNITTALYGIDSQWQIAFAAQS